VLTSIQERREFCAVCPVDLVGDECVYSHQPSFEPLSSTAGLVLDPGERFEVAGKVIFVPGEQDRFDAW
jgi:hypothetical protein